MQAWQTNPNAKTASSTRGELFQIWRIAATATATLVGLASLLVISPAHAQSAGVPSPTPVPVASITPVDSQACYACVAELTGDPLYDITARFLDVWLQWNQNPSPSLLCIAPVDDTYEFSTLPVTASVPDSSECFTQDGSIFQPPVPSAGAVTSVPTPPAAPTPTPVAPAGPAFAAPVSDIVIEQAPLTPRKPTPTLPQPTPTSAPVHSSPPRRNTPTPTPTSEVQQARPVNPVATLQVMMRFEVSSSAQSSDAHVTGTPTPTPVAPLGGSATSSADQAAAQPTATPEPTVNVVLLGYVGGDYAGDDMLKQFVQQPDTLLIGSVLVQLQLGDGTPVGLTGSTLDFTLEPADAALLAPNGDPTQIVASTFDADLGAMRQLQESIVVQDDGSVSITVGPGFLTPAADVATQDTAVASDDASAEGTDSGAVDSVDPAAVTSDDASADGTDPATVESDAAEA